MEGDSHTSETNDMKFNDGIDILKSIVESCGIAGEWRVLASDQQQFKARNGACVNWWPNGTLLFQGPAAEKAELEAAFNTALKASSASPKSAITMSKQPPRIFVVHGH